MNIRVCKSLMLMAIIVVPAQVSAQVYKWVDSNGQTHFSQTPPPESQAEPDTKVLQVQKKSAEITIKDGISYCGDLKLPSEEDPLYLLGAVKSQISNWTDQLERKQAQAQERRMSNLSSRRSSGYKDYQKRMRAGLDDLRCGLRWARAKEIELQPEYDQFQRDYQATVEEFEQYKNRCGPKPQISGYTTDPRAKEWVRCDRAGGTAEHNRRLREVKKLKSLASFLEIE